MKFRKDWMDNLPDSKFLSELTIPGTHDSATFLLVPKNPVNIWVRTQNLSTMQQLNRGCRFLDIRCNVSKNNKLNLFHGNFKLTGKLDKILNSCKKFLSDNPNECIVLSTKEEGKKHKKATFSFQEALQSSYIDNPDYSSLWWTGSHIPALGEVRGKIILARRWDPIPPYFNIDNAGLRLSISDNRAGSSQIPDNGGSQTLYYEDQYNPPSIKDKKEAIKNNITAAQASTSPDELYLTFTSFSKNNPPSYNAMRINPWMLKNLTADGRSMGIVLIDFFKTKIAHFFVDNN